MIVSFERKIAYIKVKARAKGTQIHHRAKNKQQKQNHQTKIYEEEHVKSQRTQTSHRSSPQTKGIGDPTKIYLKRKMKGSKTDDLLNDLDK